MSRRQLELQHKLGGGHFSDVWLATIVDARVKKQYAASGYVTAVFLLTPDLRCRFRLSASSVALKQLTSSDAQVQAR